ncbi:MAG: ParB/RepB/Spo0J family partition protein [Oscillospiraceae bacterium]
MANAKRKGLGKGLDALFEDNHVEEKGVTQLKISEIEPNRNQPRSSFDDEPLRELADSIRLHGVLQPLVVRPMDKGGYQIVAGERRWRASRMAGLSEVPVIIRELSDSETLEIAIIENLQREDLNVVELAQGYQSLIEEHGMTQEQVAEKVGKSRPVIANTVRLLGLPSPVLEDVRTGKISRGHAKALLSLDDEALIMETAKKVVKDQILVRDIEKLARKKKAAPKSEAARTVADTGSWGDSYFKEMEIALSSELGRKVSILQNGKKASITLEFYNAEELQDIAERLTK